MPPKRIAVNLFEKYGDIRIPQSFLPGVNPVAYTEQTALFVASPPVEQSFEWVGEHNDDEVSVPWEPAPPLGEQGTARTSSLSFTTEPPRSPEMRATYSRYF
ncbi:hypothetical protein TcCL_NonESM03522 [Trypanosoma cruzi]|nr:hypothetical protein TcCL_NonESM03522 [Trypanosoma cruzi]